MYLLAAALVSDLGTSWLGGAGAIVDRVARGAGFTEAFVLERARRQTRPQLARGSGPTLDESEHCRDQCFFAVDQHLVLAGVAFFATLRKRWQRRRQWDREELGTRDTRGL